MVVSPCEVSLMLSPFRRGAVDDGEKDEHTTTTTAATADDVLKTR